MSPQRVEKNITDVVEHFGADGLTTESYLGSALKHPSLFYWTKATVVANIASLVTSFAPNGLTTKDYLNAAGRQPGLFCMRPETVVRHITGVVDHFASDGLTITDYLNAAVRRPQLFSMSPATIATNITVVVNRFHLQGLTTSDYLRAALKQPQLFYQSPDTISGHLHLIFEMYDEGVFRVSEEPSHGHEEPERPNDYGLLIAFLLRNPLLLCLDNSNLMLRRSYREITNAAPTTAILTRKRHEIEAELLRWFGHPDINRPVLTDAHPTLITLIRDGLIKAATLQAIQ
jgi:hypothetical protein